MCGGVRSSKIKMSPEVFRKLKAEIVVGLGVPRKAQESLGGQ